MSSGKKRHWLTEQLLLLRLPITEPLAGDRGVSRRFEMVGARLQTKQEDPTVEQFKYHLKSII